MNVEKAYRHWSEQYDSNENKTRDLEAVSIRETLADISFENCLEIGCGTGKNTEWLVNLGEHITAVDISVEMLEVAKKKITSGKVKFLKVDVNKDWDFTDEKFDLIVCSLVLEHIEDINRIFGLISAHLRENGIFYMGELHPFKQYTGSKARFENEKGEEQIVSCFTHHISDYTQSGEKYGLRIIKIKEYFDKGVNSEIPRILTLVFKK